MIAAKDQVIEKVIAGNNKFIQEITENKMKEIKTLTTRVYDLQGRLSLRAVQEDTEAQFKELPSKKGESKREQACLIRKTRSHRSFLKEGAK